MHILIFKLPILGAQGGIEKDLALLLLVSTIPRNLKFISLMDVEQHPFRLTMVPAMMNRQVAQIWLVFWWQECTDQSLDTVKLGQPPISMSQMT